MSTEAYNLPGKYRLVALINQDNDSSFSVDMFRFGSPQTQFGSRNTKVTFDTKNGLVFSGARDFYYNRLDLPTFFNAQFAITEVALPNIYHTSLGIAIAINQIYGTALIEEDIVLEPVFGLYHVLKTVPSSYAWKGTIVVRMVDSNAFSLANLIRVQILNGLHYPAI